jgi:hypothetical protein
MPLNVFAAAIKLAAEIPCQPRYNLCSELDPTNREAERDDHCVQDSIIAVGESCLHRVQRPRVRVEVIIVGQVRGLNLLCS